MNTLDLLIIEDNQELGQLLKDFLTNEGFSVEWVTSAEDGITALKSTNFKLLLLDVCLPNKNGFEAISEIRKTRSIPVFMMSARTDEDSKMLGFNLGADDYIDKPFSIPVLSSKIKALIRRTYNEDSPTTETKQILEGYSIKLDETTHSVYKNGIKLDVKGKEFEILAYLMKHSGQVVDKDVLFNKIWGDDCYTEQTSLNVYIRWLREKIEDDPKVPKLIQTVWKVGYKFGGEE